MGEWTSYLIGFIKNDSHPPLRFPPGTTHFIVAGCSESLGDESMLQIRKLRSAELSREAASVCTQLGRSRGLGRSAGTPSLCVAGKLEERRKGGAGRQGALRLRLQVSAAQEEPGADSHSCSHQIWGNGMVGTLLVVTEPGGLPR